NELGWTAPRIVASFVVGVALLVSFVAWELRAEQPMLPMRFFRNRTFALANVSSLFMFFGMLGSIFFIAQFFQTVHGLSPAQSGLRILPWTAMPMLVAPIAGTLSDCMTPVYTARPAAAICTSRTPPATPGGRLSRWGGRSSGWEAAPT